jgi:hypothetical protein
MTFEDARDFLAVIRNKILPEDASLKVSLICDGCRPQAGRDQAL